MHNLLVDVLIKHQHKGAYIKGIVEQAKATLDTT